MGTLPPENILEPKIKQTTPHVVKYVLKRFSSDEFVQTWSSNWSQTLNFGGTTTIASIIIIDSIVIIVEVLLLSLVVVVVLV